MVISDAIYDELVYDELEYTEIIELAPSLKDRYFIVNGVSKAFAMTGWRLGYTLGPAAIIKGMQTLQSQSTSNPSSITQAATIAALERNQEVVAPLRACFATRRDLIVSLLGEIDGVTLQVPRGAFYVFPDISSFIGKKAHGRVITDDMEFAAYLLEEAGVAVVPGSAFGAPGFMRLSYASGDVTIRKGVARIAEALERLS